MSRKAAAGAVWLEMRSSHRVTVTHVGSGITAQGRRLASDCCGSCLEFVAGWTVVLERAGWIRCLSKVSGGRRVASALANDVGFAASSLIACVINSWSLDALPMSFVMETSAAVVTPGCVGCLLSKISSGILVARAFSKQILAARLFHECRSSTSQSDGAWFHKESHAASELKSTSSGRCRRRAAGADERTCQRYLGEISCGKGIARALARDVGIAAGIIGITSDGQWICLEVLPNGTLPHVRVLGTKMCGKAASSVLLEASGHLCVTSTLARDVVVAAQRICCASNSGCICFEVLPSGTLELERTSKMTCKAAGGAVWFEASGGRVVAITLAGDCCDAALLFLESIGRSKRLDGGRVSLEMEASAAIELERAGWGGCLSKVSGGGRVAGAHATGSDTCSRGDGRADAGGTIFNLQRKLNVVESSGFFRVPGIDDRVVVLDAHQTIVCADSRLSNGGDTHNNEKWTANNHAADPTNDLVSVVLDVAVHVGVEGATRLVKAGNLGFVILVHGVWKKLVSELSGSDMRNQ